MKLGCSSQSYDGAFREKRIDLFSWIDHCASVLRVDGVEIEDKHFPVTSDDFLDELRARVQERKLGLSSVTIMNDFGLPARAEREAQLDYVRGWLGRAQRLGALVVRVFAGWPKEKAREELWDEMVDCLRRACVEAERAGVLLAMENHNHGGFVQVAEDALRIFEQVGSRWLRLNLDTGNYLDGLRSIEKTAAWAAHVHAKLYHIAEDGADHRLDYRRILGALQRAGYRGFVSLEYEGPQDPFEVVPRAVKRLRELLREVGAGDSG